MSQAATLLAQRPYHSALSRMSPQSGIRSLGAKAAALAVHGIRSIRDRPRLNALAAESPVARALLAVSRDDFAEAERAVFAEIENTRRRLCERRDTFEWMIDDPLDTKSAPALRRYVVGEWARTTSVKPPWGRLLYSLAREVRPETCLELGSSVGISGLYIQAGLREAGGGSFTTIEGSGVLAEVAAETYRAFGFRCFTSTAGDFDRQLSLVLAEMPPVGLAFVDGNHQKEPTLRYDALIRSRAVEGTVIVHDDIRWSAEMARAWNTVRDRSGTKLVADAFRVGLVELGQVPIQPYQVRAWLGAAHLA